MEKLDLYREWIMKVLQGNFDPPTLMTEGVEEQLLFDTIRDHYQILAIGWENKRRVYFPILHLDIKNGKIWVQENSTDLNIAAALEEKGVPKSDIVLAFHTPNVRPFTGYAVA